MNKLPCLDIEYGDTIALGAEARTYYATFLGYDVVVKHRFAKKYRAEAIDNLLRKNRSIQEVRLLHLARKIGVRVPFVLDIDKIAWKIIQERILGVPLKDRMNNVEVNFNKVGEYMALLHENNIIHGDLTTSNILLDEEDNIWFIDFGLGYISTQIEDKAVDILVLKHTLTSSHNALLDIAFNAFIKGYSINKEHKSIIKRMEKVEERIRYT